MHHLSDWTCWILFMCTGVCSINFNPQSTIVATGSMDTTAKLWVVQKGLDNYGTLTLHCCTKWSSLCEWPLAKLALLCECNFLTHRVILQRLYLVHSTQLVINYWLAHLIILWVCGTQEQAGKRKKKRLHMNWVKIP